MDQGGERKAPTVRKTMVAARAAASSAGNTTMQKKAGGALAKTTEDARGGTSLSGVDEQHSNLSEVEDIDDDEEEIPAAALQAKSSLPKSVTKSRNTVVNSTKSLYRGGFLSGGDPEAGIQHEVCGKGGGAAGSQGFVKQIPEGKLPPAAAPPRTESDEMMELLRGLAGSIEDVKARLGAIESKSPTKAGRNNDDYDDGDDGDDDDDDDDDDNNDDAHDDNDDDEDDDEISARGSTRAMKRSTKKGAASGDTESDDSEFKDIESRPSSRARPNKSKSEVRRVAAKGSHVLNARDNIKRVDQTEAERAALTAAIYTLDAVYLNPEMLTLSPRQLEELLNDARSRTTGLQAVLPNGSMTKLNHPEGRNRDQNLSNLCAILPVFEVSGPFGRNPEARFSATFCMNPSMMIQRALQYQDILITSRDQCSDELLTDPPKKRRDELRRRAGMFSGIYKEFKVYSKFLIKELKSMGCGEKQWRTNPTWLSDFAWLRVFDAVRLNRYLRVVLYGGTDHFPASHFGANTLNLAIASELATFRGRRRLRDIPSPDFMRVLLLISGGDCRICGYRGCMLEFCFRCNKSGESKSNSRKALPPNIDPNVVTVHAAAKKKVFDSIDAGTLSGTEKKKAKKVWSTANPTPAAPAAAGAPPTTTITLEYLCSHQHLVPERSSTYAEDDGDEDA